jgi:hypothetical protein
MQTFLALPSTAYTASGGGTSISLGPVPRAIQALAVDVNVTAASGTSPSLTLILERLAADGNWYEIWSPTAITAAGAASTSIGPGCATAQVYTQTIRLRWLISGTSPSFTFSASIVGWP